MEEFGGKILTGIIIAVLIFMLQSAGVHKLIAGIFGGASSPLLESIFTSDFKEEERYWASAEKCGIKECYQLYLDKYPQGKFKDFASMYVKDKAIKITAPVVEPKPKAVADDIDSMIKANFGGYTKVKPLKVFILPFKPAERFDVESNIGKIVWKGATDALKDSAFFSDKRIKPEIINDGDYAKILRKSFWDDMSKGDKKIKDILHSTARDYGVNSLIYGLYDGGDSSLKLIIYFYSKNDDIVLKEKTETKAHFMDLRSLRDAVKSGETLTIKQKSLRRKIHEKSKVATTHLLRKYMEGK